MDQRLFTQFVLGILARELLFEFRIGFTPEERQVLSLTRFPSSAEIDVCHVFAIAKSWQVSSRE
jgi:hypothetical protein